MGYGIPRRICTLASFKLCLRNVSQRTLIIVDEAYLEYAPDSETLSAVSLVRDGANILVFRTFDKIHGFAGLPIFSADASVLANMAMTSFVFHGLRTKREPVRHYGESMICSDGHSRSSYSSVVD